MKKIFKEYHQFTEDEYKKLWKNCLFVFDTNTLLNMYRYSRKTVKAYFDVLQDLKDGDQIWIPYQVGFEFYENRINVITEYEKSYDEVLLILEKAKKDIETKYKDHPFLDLNAIKTEMEAGLSGVEIKINNAKKEHPKWLEIDEVLDNLDKLFEGNIGISYSETKITEIKRQGKERYERKIPPGFKDDKKPDDKKYGDLILWYQIIDKAKEIKKPIILISGDIKEDWWLEKEGKRIMPLPQLRKEIYDKAGVDFHIYTADRFLELYKSDTKTVDDSTIKEVRKIRELEEKRMIMSRTDNIENSLHQRIGSKSTFVLMNNLNTLENILVSLRESEIRSKYSEDLNQMFRILRNIRNKILHEDYDRIEYLRIMDFSKEISFFIKKMIHSEELNSVLVSQLRGFLFLLDNVVFQIERITDESKNYYR